MGATLSDYLVKLLTGIMEDRSSLDCIKNYCIIGEWNEIEKWVWRWEKQGLGYPSFAFLSVCDASDLLLCNKPLLNFLIILHGFGVWAPELSSSYWGSLEQVQLNAAGAGRHLKASLFKGLRLGLGTVARLKWLDTAQASLSPRSYSIWLAWLPYSMVGPG